MSRPKMQLVDRQIANRPAAFFLIVNVSVITAGVIVILSGTPLKTALLSTALTLALMNLVLFLLRRVFAKSLPAVTPTAATPSLRRAWLWLILGIFIVGNSISQIASPHLPSDRSLGYATLIASPALFYLAWREFRKRRGGAPPKMKT